MEPADEFMVSPSDGRSKAPRLFVKEMIMRNFKSYAGEKHVGPFHKSFSAVVGPNGSGKSNVIDAMLFVFGKRAKQMRLRKVSELIHNSTNHQNLDSASVSVHFQEIIDLDDGTYEAVTGSDFVVTRFAFRDNSSKYCINDRASNFTEVTKKLKGKGVDLDNNRFLILQGEVEQISLMKPKAQGPYDEGFLEYLEDIIGTNKYVEKIDESYEELESLNERRSGVMQLVKLAEKERDRLENSKNEAETYMLKELSVLKWQEKATKLAYKDASAYMVVLQENVSSMEENLKRKREKIQESNYNLKRLQASYKNYMKRQEELDNGLRVCGDNVKEFERQDLEYQADLKHMDQKIERLEKKVDKDVLKINNISKECEESTNLILKLDKDIPQLRTLLCNEEKAIEEIKEKSKVETERYRSELAKVRDELEPWEKQLIEHKGKLEVASTESKLLNEKQEAARVAFEDAQKKMDGIMRRTKTTSTSIQIIESNLEEKKCQALEAHKIEQECLKEREALAPLEHAARQKVAELLSGMESEKIQGSVLKGILQAKESNQIGGIYGRMGDLGAIDEKYEVAISTACPGLDYIVVETTGAAQACVELLRKENLGVATFMILEKQVGHLHRLKEKVSTPEGVPRLFDLVKVQDERMKLAFFAAMENTVVAAGIDQASRIAYGRNKEFRRVVTLDGTLFEKSGTISGGGSKPQGGKMGTSMRATSVSAEAFATAEKELATIVDKLNYICHRVSDAVSHYRASEKEVAHLEMELAKRQKEIKSLESEDSYFRKQLTSRKAESQLRKDEIQRLEELKNIISIEEEEIVRLLKGFNQLKKKAKVLQSKIENAGGEKLKMQKAKVTKIQSDIDKNNSEINRQKVQREMCKKTLKKLTKGVEESKKEKKQIAEEQKKLTSAFKKQEKISLRDRENIKTQLEAIDQHRHALDNAKSEYDKLKKTVDELRASEVSDDYKLQDMKKSYMEMEMEGKGYAMKLLDLQISIKKHLEQIQKDEVDPRKLHTTLTSETLSKGCDLKWALEKIALLETQVKKMNPNLNSIAEYRRKVVLYNERVEDLNVVTQQRDDVKKRYDEWRRKRLDEFMDGFKTISLKLKEMYQMITIEGDAELEIVDPFDPFSSGVVFSVRPPKKSWKNIANLSGGEKTLSSLALVFALHHYKPTPIYVMDEIDATLDFRNVSIVGHYVKDYNQDTQFIIVSLRNNMFELADRLVGTYKTDNCTNTVTINPGNFVVCKNAA